MKKIFLCFSALFFCAIKGVLAVESSVFPIESSSLAVQEEGDCDLEKEQKEQKEQFEELLKIKKTEGREILTIDLLLKKYKEEIREFANQMKEILEDFSRTDKGKVEAIQSRWKSIRDFFKKEFSEKLTSEECGKYGDHLKNSFILIDVFNHFFSISGISEWTFEKNKILFNGMKLFETENRRDYSDFDWSIFTIGMIESLENIETEEQWKEGFRQFKEILRFELAHGDQQWKDLPIPMIPAFHCAEMFKKFALHSLKNQEDLENFFQDFGLVRILKGGDNQESTMIKYLLNSIAKECSVDPESLHSTILKLLVNVYCGKNSKTLDGGCDVDKKNKRNYVFSHLLTPDILKKENSEDKASYLESISKIFSDAGLKEEDIASMQFEAGRKVFPLKIIPLKEESMTPPILLTFDSSRFLEK